MPAAVTPSSSYKESLVWLFGTQLFGIKLGLENIRKLLLALHLPGSNQRVIHIAGTNGKGSVCAIIEAIARTEGYRTGLFTSPHLVTFRERIQVGGEMIAEAAVVNGLNRIRELISDWDPPPTFFEITTALALQHFSHAGCDVVVLETGMGGRLDATNAITPVVSVITPIALDHQKWLGNTLAEVAGEKAGIIKPRVPVVSSIQNVVAETVLRTKAAACEAPIEFVGRGPRPLRVNLVGSHQQENAALAIAALRASGITVDGNSIAAGLATVTWPARFQRWNDQLVIDGAHNPAGAAALAQSWKEIFAETRAAVILAILRDKDAAGIVAALAPIASRIILPEARAERAIEATELAEVTRRIVAPSCDVTLQPSLAAALDQAKSTGSPVLVTGSLHFAGEALALLHGDPDELEDCLQ